MTNPPDAAHVASALAHVVAATADLQPTEAIPPVVVLDTPAAFDTAYAAAAPGAVLTLSNTLVYPTALTLAKAVTLQCAASPAGRMTATAPLPSFRDGLTITGDDVTLFGVEVKKQNHLTDIVTFSGARVMLDGCRFLGDPVAGAKRAVAANGNGNCTIIRCYMDDCFQASPGNDSQCIIAWDMAPGLLIEDNYLCGGSESVLLGGADSTSDARMPADVTIRGNTITANPTWMTKAIGVKTRLEIKAGRHILVEGNIVEQCWKQGQSGYLLSLTTRNQDGAAPWSTIEDVLIQDNQFAHGCGAINILSSDNNHPSGRLTRVQIFRNTFLDLDPVHYMNGSSKPIQIDGGPIDLTLSNNTFVGVGLTTNLYFLGAPKCENFVCTSNHWSASMYHTFGSNSSVGLDPATGLPKSWIQFVASGTFSGNVETP